jgi:excisionase family DNA binding protein
MWVYGYVVKTATDETTKGGQIMDVELYYLKVGDVAERLSLDESTVYKMVRERELPSVRLGKKAVRIPAAGLDAYLRKHEIAASHDSSETGASEERLTTLLYERAERFTAEVGSDPLAFSDAWRRHEIEDTAENADRAIEAFALATALDRVGKADAVFA